MPLVELMAFQLRINFKCNFVFQNHCKASAIFVLVWLRNPIDQK